MYVISKTLELISAAHRLIGDYHGKCETLHGHNYEITVTFESNSLDSTGFLVDFQDIKTICNDWVEKHWDHALLINSNDISLIEFAQLEKQKYFILQNGKNSTVENLSKILFDNLEQHICLESSLRKDIKLIQVEIAETRSSKALYRPSND
jgi:6-pyruvoyltetrahydropterin/6-carboxytetrahydropterin synthase